MAAILLLLLGFSWSLAVESALAPKESESSASAMLGAGTGAAATVSLSGDYSSLLSNVPAASPVPANPSQPSGPANQCSWSYNGTSSVHCALRLIERQPGLDLQGADGSSQLTIQCSELYLFESTLPVAVFARLQTLEALRLDSCKLLQLPNNAFEGLATLKSLRLSTHNSEWGPTRTLELFPTLSVV